MLRLTYEDSAESIDARLVRHLESLGAVSANKQQEWIRGALRNSFIKEELVLMRDEEKKNKQVQHIEI